MPVDEKSGKKKSRKTGRCIGRPPIQPPADFEEYYQKWRQKELTAIATMKALGGLKPNTFYKLVHQYEADHPNETK